ncbi:DegT/DnrJ/EryC1/StrS family aminotransferase [Marinifilum flexuosum]|uniref:Aminotransferase EvaB n=1 Tax=Marinifilum flexuosum TaxID=1117708 RepID=A0A419X9L5_9BACT|nr:DegT/DnrJ/EryC1/StrS family aminotransferase [Marinifilum flexuosum]RKE04336.1 aminotransferase EvaB [Marinifilum flexuosum]
MKFWNYLDELKKEQSATMNAIQEVLNSGQLILGEKVSEFEKKFANYSQTKYGIGVANGTDALFLALKALKIDNDSEVITVANTAVPTVSAIVSTGATPIFVDIDPQSLLMDVNKVEQLITSKTKCILPVHLYGQCVDMEPLKILAKKYNLYIVEDCAQAHGASYKNQKAGSMGDASAFSFYPTKVLGTYGDGGLICTKSSILSNELKSLRFYGMKEAYSAETHGYNSRLDELQAAILLIKFKHINHYIKRRQEIAAIYDNAFSSLPLQLPIVGNNNEHVYYQYVCRHTKRNKIVAALKKQGIPVAITYPHPIHLMNGYSQLGYKIGDLPITEQAANEVFSLPLYPSMPNSDIEQVIKTVQKTIKYV